MKDFLGQEIKVDDVVYYHSTGRYSDANIVKIYRLTPKQAVGTKLKSNRRFPTKDEVKITNGSHCVVINDVPAALKFKE